MELPCYSAPNRARSLNLAYGENPVAGNAAREGTPPPLEVAPLLPGQASLKQASRDDHVIEVHQSGCAKARAGAYKKASIRLGGHNVH